jgi:hypothetical protein
LPDWVLGGSADAQCAAFGLCTNASLTYPLCLSAWRGEVGEAAPLVWSRCRTDVYAHQQWRRVRADADGASPAFLLAHGERPTAAPAEPLCVAAPLPTRLLLQDIT